jgi:prepilin-type N-terminal cleavage/methylation domain-containing protein
MNRLSIQHKTGFTLVEVVAALLILSMLISSALVVMSNITEGMIDLKAQTQAFSIARQNMEKLLTSASVEDLSEYGIVETNPDMDWQTVVEPFYEPISNRMWVRGVCSSSYTDSKGQRQIIELTCWLTGLTAQQIKQIVDQQKRQEEYMSQFSESEYGKELAQQREITSAFLEQENLDADAYKDFIERLERRRLDYIADKGFDEGYFDFLEELQQDESDFLYRLGVTDYDKYMDFYENYIDNPENLKGDDESSGKKKTTSPGLDINDDEPTLKDSTTKQKSADTTDIPDEIKKLLPEDFFKQ